MIRRLKALVSWLESRFPEKVVVTAEHYRALSQDLDQAGREITTWIGEVSAVKARVAVVEASAVHKEAVQDLITIVKALKDDVTALKANLGWGKTAEVADLVRATLNGEEI